VVEIARPAIDVEVDAPARGDDDQCPHKRTSPTIPRACSADELD